jgi:tripartite-type tricarboxylate transporter receptor subunit TctC
MATPLAVTVAADQPWRSIEELIRYAAQHPGELKFGHSGLGSGTHVAGEIFAKQANVNIVQVPFRGEGETIAALLGGHIQLAFVNSPLVKEYLKSGKVRVLAVSADKRLSDPVLQNIPTLKEQGQDMVFSLWHGIAAPKGLPANVKARLAEVLKDTMNDPQFIKHMADLGMTVEYLGPKEFGDKWLSENTKLTKMVKDTGIAGRIASQKN